MKQSTKTTIKNASKFLTAVALLSVAVAMEFQDQEVAVQQYCENVKDNTWPNYKEVDLTSYCK